MNLLKSWSPWMGDRPDAIKKQEKRGHTSMPRVGFETTIPVLERWKTVRASERQNKWIRSRLSGLFQFRTWLLKFMYLFLDIWQDFLDGGSARHKATTYTGQHNTTQRKADTYPCLERDSKSWCQCSSGRRQYVP